MPSWSKDVYSKMAQTVSYNDETKELSVTFAKGGKPAVYSGVPEELAVRLANTVSVGSMMHEEIIPYYPMHYA